MLRSRIEAIRKMADSHLAWNRGDGPLDRLVPAIAESTREKPAADGIQRTAQHALSLVLQTGQMIRAAEERGQAIADKSQELAVRAVNELRAADDRIKSLEQRLAEAEARATQAEEWLQRVCEAIETNTADLSPVISPVAAVQAA